MTSRNMNSPEFRVQDVVCAGKSRGVRRKGAAGTFSDASYHDQLFMTPSKGRDMDEDKLRQARQGEGNI
jgi:hypothetical protein